MTINNQTRLGILERNQASLTFKLIHAEDIQDALRRNDPLIATVTLDGALRSDNGTWVVQLKQMGNGQPQANNAPDWKELTVNGCLSHSSQDGRLWKPDEESLALLRKVFPDDMFQVLRNRVIATSTGRARLETFLTTATSIPWSREQTPADAPTGKKLKLLHLDLELFQREDRLKREHADLQRRVDTEGDAVMHLEALTKNLETALTGIDPQKQELERVLEELAQARENLGRHLHFLGSRTARHERPARTPLRGVDDEALALREAMQRMRTAGRQIAWPDLLTIHLGLMHAPFTVLQGDPGAGKTSALQLYAAHMGLCVDTVPVSQAWATPEDVFGYYDMLSKKFVAGELGRILMHHQPLPGEGVDQPGHRARLVILDEINLVTVEQVFSNLMSVLALDDPSRRLIRLHHHEGEHLPLQEYVWPSGLLMAGTANDDGTTVAFSDRFRDRSTIHYLKGPGVDGLLERESSRVNTPGLPRDTAAGDPSASADPGHPDVTCATWSTWKQLGTAPLHQGAAMVKELRRWTSEADERHISPRSLGRSHVMAIHATRLIESLSDELAKEQEVDVSLGQRDSGGHFTQEAQEAQTRLAVSLAAVPNLAQRVVRLHGTRGGAAEQVEKFLGIAHPATHGALQALAPIR